MIKTWTGWRARAGLAVAGRPLGALVAAAPSVSACALAGRGTPSASGPVAVTAAGQFAVWPSGRLMSFSVSRMPHHQSARCDGGRHNPAASWRGVRDATQFAPRGPQSSSPFGQASTSENCVS